MHDTHNTTVTHLHAKQKTSSKTSSQVTLKDVYRFLLFLANVHPSDAIKPENQHINFTGIITDKKGKVISKSLTDTIHNLYSKTVQKDGTLHVTLNKTDFLGRKSTNIKSPRVLCVDLDYECKIIDDYITMYSPDLVVESSPLRYHLYWKISEETDLVDWQKAQKKLAKIFNADASLSQITHLMRVPGFPRITKAGDLFTPAIIHFKRTFLEQPIPVIFGSFPGSSKPSKAANLPATKSPAILHTITPGTRNNVLFSLAASNATLLITPLSLEEMLDLNNFLDNSIHEYDPATSTITNAYTKLFKVVSDDNARLSQPLPVIETVSITKSALKGALTSTLEQLQAINAITSRVSNAHEPFVYDMSAIDAVGAYTDTGLATRIVQKYHEAILRCKDQIYAYNYKNKVWKLQTKNNHAELSLFLNSVVSDILIDPRFLRDCCSDNDGNISDALYKKQEHKFRSNAQLNSICNSILNYLCVNEDILTVELRDIDYEAFDSDPDKLQLANGCLSLLKGEIKPASPLDLCVAKVNVTWEAPDLRKAQNWQEFLYSLFPYNPEMLPFLQRVVGYSISGDISEQVLFCHIGSGANGKSKFLSALAAISGSYSTILEPNAILASKNEVKIERLGSKVEGKRCVIVDDVELNAEWSEAFVKTLTSDSIRARAEHQISRVIPNRAKFHLGMNQLPVPQSQNYGFLRRILFIPYEEQFTENATESKRIDKLITNCKVEILNWAVEGYQRWKRALSLQIPHVCILKKEAYLRHYFPDLHETKKHFSKPTGIPLDYKPIPLIDKNYMSNVVEEAGYLCGLYNLHALIEWLNLQQRMDLPSYPTSEHGKVFIQKIENALRTKLTFKIVEPKNSEPVGYALLGVHKTLFDRSLHEKED